MTSARVAIPGTALKVSRLCLGGLPLGERLGQDQSFALLDAFVALGGNFIDTAHVYGDWVPDLERSASERTIGRWLKARGLQSEIVIATKIAHPHLATMHVPRLDPAALRSDAEASCEYLGTERLNLVYLHRDDPFRPVADIIGAMEELRHAGLVGHYGASNWSAARLQEALDFARAENCQGFVANQPEWSLARRNPGSASMSGLVEMNAAMFAFHERTGMAAVPYTTQAKGYFSKFKERAVDPGLCAAFDSPGNRQLATGLAAIGKDLGMSGAAMAVAALMTAPFPVIPVVGCSTPAQVEASFSALRPGLPTDVLRQYLRDRIAEPLGSARA